MTVTNLVYLFVGVAAIAGANSLIASLGRDQVPSGLQPIASWWIQTGGDTKWVRRLMWLLFFICAAVFFLLLGIPLYSAIQDLGSNWNS